MVYPSIGTTRDNMSYYTHILICWEGGHTIGYADPEKIMKIASKYVDKYEKYEKEYDKLCELEKQKKLRKEKLIEGDYKRFRELENEMATQATIDIMRSIASGKALFKGTKGCLWISGGIFNYTDGYMVLDEMKDFFKELWDNKCFGIGNVVCFTESEQSNEARILVLDNVGEIHEVEKEEKWCWGLNW